MDLSTSDMFVLAVAAMVAGILLLIRGGNWTIDSAIYIARKFNVSPLIVGFTIVAFGTSLPELVVSVFANMGGSGGIALGNVIGSNIANIFCVMGLTALFVNLKMRGPLLPVSRDLIMLLLSTVVLIGLLLFVGDIGRVVGALMLLLLVGYTVMQYRMAQKGVVENPLELEGEPEFKSDKMAYLFLFLGLVGIALGAEFLVRGAKVSAAILDVPEAIVALSVIAFGTSLPELSTCLIAARRGHVDLAFGNIIGSNVFNILMILGITSIVHPIAANSYTPQLANFDVWVALAASVVFALSLWFLRGIPKVMGGLFFLSYLVYNGYIYIVNMGG